MCPAVLIYSPVTLCFCRRMRKTAFPVGCGQWSPGSSCASSGKEWVVRSRPSHLDSGLVKKQDLFCFSAFRLSRIESFYDWFFHCTHLPHLPSSIKIVYFKNWNNAVMASSPSELQSFQCPAEGALAESHLLASCRGHLAPSSSFLL